MTKERVIALAEACKKDKGSPNCAFPGAASDDANATYEIMGDGQRLFKKKLLDLGQLESRFWLEAVHTLEINNHSFEDLEILVGALVIVYTNQTSPNGVRIIAKPRKWPLMKVMQKNLGELRALNLNESRIFKITHNAAMCKNLSTLMLQRNNLVNLPDGIGELSHLTVLDVSKNKLRSLPNSLGRLSALVELDVSCNLLSHLPVSISRLVKLKELRLSNNMVRTIPRDYGNLAQLSSLDATNNLLRYLPAEINSIRGLRRISLQGNPLISDNPDLLKHHDIFRSAQGPTLYEEACRASLCYGDRKRGALTTSIRLTLKAAQKCNFCSGPFVQSFLVRVRFLRKNSFDIPFAFSLCCNHWEEDQSRLRAIFSGIPNTCPNSELWKVRQFGTSCVGKPQSTQYYEAHLKSDCDILEKQVRLSPTELLPIIDHVLIAE